MSRVFDVRILQEALCHLASYLVTEARDKKQFAAICTALYAPQLVTAVLQPPQDDACSPVSCQCRRR